MKVAVDDAKTAYPTFITLTLSGIRDALPIMIAYFPVSVTFGILCSSVHLGWFSALLISLCVYAGGAQFMLVALAAAGTAPIPTIVTVLLVNVRHLLYGTALGPAFAHWTPVQKWLVAFGLTDEVFAVTSSRLSANRDLAKTLPPPRQIAFTFACYAAWASGTLAGAGIGRAVPSAWASTLEYALPALFLALLFLGERSVAHLAAAICGGGIACLAGHMHLGSLGIVIGGVIGATVGYACQTGWRKKSAPT